MEKACDSPWKFLWWLFEVRGLKLKAVVMFSFTFFYHAAQKLSTVLSTKKKYWVVNKKLYECDFDGCWTALLPPRRFLNWCWKQQNNLDKDINGYKNQREKLHCWEWWCLQSFKKRFMFILKFSWWVLVDKNSQSFFLKRIYETNLCESQFMGCPTSG